MNTAQPQRFSGYNETRPNGAGNTIRPLTHSLEDGKEGLAMKATQCAVTGCNHGGRLIRGWCNKHYKRWIKYGDPTVTHRPELEATTDERFWSKVRQMGDCWEWTGYTSVDGYGRFRAQSGSNAMAHRWSYEALVADIPDGLQLDHLCRNRSCVNPYHLEPVTAEVNLARSEIQEAAQALRDARTHCNRGHEYDEANTHWCGPTRSYRKCRACQALTARMRRNPWRKDQA